MIKAGLKTALKWLAAGSLALACMPGYAADARAQLERFVAEVESATGSFTQQVADDRGSLRQAQTGEFAFKRPGLFRWQTLKPYAQLVISDGKLLRQYDPDLAQVTERPVGESIGASPAAILFGSGSLDEAFEVSNRPDRDGLAWLRAKPRSGDAGFAHVDIGFAEGLPRRLELLDAFGQTTRIGLSDINSNPKLAADIFTFEVPADVDVVRMQ
ncbi:MAG TPA: outer membrane lipoprotein chaperone LolA [Burkholderiaceae bacterium]|nr:outer membrane lipoprotein chaperone LolA [Burkholderiaceae bacterium]